MSIRLRTKKLIWAGVIGASVMLVISAVGGYLFYTKSQERELKLKEEYRKEIAALNETAKLNEVGYALKEDVGQGIKITEDMLVPVTLPKAAKAEDDLGPIEVNTVNFYTRTDLKASTTLVRSMVYEEEPISNDVREGEYAFIELPTKLKQDDYVDIRIQFPNGDDFIFLSKKKVKEVTGLTMWMNMNEGEQLTMSSAIVDAFVEEAKIYAMPYVDGPMQRESTITYPVKTNVLDLIKNSPNIVNIAKLNLENQNRQRLESGLQAVDDEDRQKLRSGQSQSDSKREQHDADRELNATNNINQENLVGTTSEGKDN